MNAFYPPTLPCLTTTENTRDIHIRRLYPHAHRNSPTLGQLYVQKLTTKFKSLQYSKLNITYIHLSLK